MNRAASLSVQKAILKILIELESRLNEKRVVYHENNQAELIERSKESIPTTRQRCQAKPSLTTEGALPCGRKKKATRTESSRLIQTCCSYFCLSESSCWENSLAWFSLRVLDCIRSSSTFSIWWWNKTTRGKKGSTSFKVCWWNPCRISNIGKDVTFTFINM